jgi:predicted ribosomally synthesized peptide with SipW-like signal peptide
VAASISGLGTFAAFSDTETGSTAIDSGVVAMTIGANGTANRLSVAATDIVPGDTVDRVANLTVDSTTTSTPSSITLSTSASVSNLLTSDTTHGLQMEIASCSVPWTEAGSSPAYTYTCSGTQSAVLASRPIVGSDLALSNMGLEPGTTNYLRVRVTLPSTAGNTFQDLGTTVTYSFTANQRAATNR